MWGRSGRKRIGSIKSAWKRSKRLITKRDEGRAYYSGNALRLGIGALTLLTLISLIGWLLRRRAKEEETAPLAPALEEGAQRLPSPFKSPEGEAEFLAAYEATLRLWPVPYEPMDIPSRFGRTHLVVSGPEDAPPVVLLHSFFMSLTVWAYNVADLSRDYRVYALDMIGQPGKSIPDQPISNRAEMAEWLTSVLDELGIRQTDLMGWSYGGFAALNYAIHRPDRLRKLILLTPIGSFVPLKRQFYVRGMLTRLPGRFWANNMMHWFCYEPTLNDEDTRRMFGCLTNQFYPGMRYFRLPPTVLPVPFTDEELWGVRNPTLLLIGEQEALYDPVAAIARAKRLIPNIKTELIPQAGHELGFSKAETINSRVLEFLKE